MEDRAADEEALGGAVAASRAARPRSPGAGATAVEPGSGVMADGMVPGGGMWWNGRSKP